jgi:hypothetical protein
MLSNFVENAYRQNRVRHSEKFFDESKPREQQRKLIKTEQNFFILGVFEKNKTEAEKWKLY